jgi:hypothetical protein
MLETKGIAGINLRVPGELTKDTDVDHLGDLRRLV